MGTKPAKSTGTRKRPASKSTERPVTELERAEAVIYVHEQGGKRVTADNPFLTTSGLDTVQYVRCGLDYLSQLSLKDAGIATDDDIEFGRYLVLQTMVLALDAAREQMRNEHELTHARATVRALKGEA